MNRKKIGTLLIAGLIAMAVFVGTAAANGGAEIYGSRFFDTWEKRHNFETINNLYGWGDFGDYSYTYGNPPCPDGCGGRIYVVEHKETWTNGDPLIDKSSDGYETVPWGNFFFEMAWPTPLKSGTYDLILDLNVSGTENYYVWTDIPNPAGSGEPYITDPIWNFTVTGEPEPTPTVESSDISGAIKDTFQPGEPVYAIGNGYAATTNYNLYVVDDTTWSDGMAIPGRVSETATSVTTDSDGKIDPHPTQIWASSVIGEYDIVVDVNGNGYYDEGIDALDDLDVNGAGFEVIPEFSTIAIPVASVLGLLFLFNYRKRMRKE